MSYHQASGWVGSVKSSLCRWVRRKVLGEPELRGRVLELYGIWTRFLSGPKELKVIRDGLGVVLGHFGSWEEAIDRGWQAGAQDPLHRVSDGDRAIARDCSWYMADGRPASCVTFISCRNIAATWAGKDGKKRRSCCPARVDGRGGLREENCSGDGRPGSLLVSKGAEPGIAHLDTGQERYKTTSRLERLNRELRRREKLGTVWSPHNLLALLEIRGLVNQST